MPLPTPLTTEMVAMAVITAMRMTMNVLEASSMTPSSMSPVETWVTPRPSDVATPKRVPTMARMSTTSPIQPLTRSPRSGSSAQRRETGRPLRWIA